MPGPRPVLAYHSLPLTVSFCCGAINALQALFGVTKNPLPRPPRPSFRDLILPLWRNEKQPYVNLVLAVSEPAWGREAMEKSCAGQIFLWWLDSFGERSGSSGAASQRATRTVESLSSDVHVCVRARSGSVLGCTSRSQAQTQLAVDCQLGEKVTFLQYVTVSRVVRVIPFRAAYLKALLLWLWSWTILLILQYRQDITIKLCLIIRTSCY